MKISRERTSLQQYSPSLQVFLPHLGPVGRQNSSVQEPPGLTQYPQDYTAAEC